MTNGVFDVDEVVEGGVTRVYDTSGNFFVAAGPGRLQGSDAANALVDLINGPNIDDTYTQTDLRGRGGLDPITVADVRPGDPLRISGTTNLAVGDNLLITVISSAFEPTNKSAASGTSGLSGQTTVQRGEGGPNTFNFTADTTGLAVDTYQVTVESPDAGASQTATFRVTNEAGGERHGDRDPRRQRHRHGPDRDRDPRRHGDRHGQRDRDPDDDPGLRHARRARGPGRRRAPRRAPAGLRPSPFFLPLPRECIFPLPRCIFPQ